MFDDVSRSIKSSLYDRATSPLFGAFAISWLAWNYKLILVVFSSLVVGKKIIFIETMIYTESYSLLLSAFIYPLLTSITFIFLYPIPASHIYRYWHSQQIKLKKIKQEIEDETPLTIEESRNIRREILTLESKYDSEITRKDSEISRLKEIVKNLESSLSNPNDSEASKKPKKTKVQARNVVASKTVTEEQSSILKNIASSGGFRNEPNLLSESPFDKVKTEYLIEDLKAKGYLTYGYNSSYGDTGAELTTTGKKYSVENEFVS